MPFSTEYNHYIFISILREWYGEKTFYIKLTCQRIHIWYVNFFSNCLVEPFKYAHFGKVIKGNSIDMRAEVALLTRNIVIEGEMEDSCPPGNGNCDNAYVYGLDTFGAHVKVRCRELIFLCIVIMVQYWVSIFILAYFWPRVFPLTCFESIPMVYSRFCSVVMSASIPNWTQYLFAFISIMIWFSNFLKDVFIWIVSHIFGWFYDF